jgi:hypothetical protein
MAPSVPDRLADVHPRMVGFDPQKAGILAGRIIERALDYAGLEVKEAAATMGYGDATTLYRWIAGKEAANFDKLWLLGEKFQEGLVIGLATACRTLRVRTTIEAERSA